MKKIIAISLFIIICISHLNILDAVMHFSCRYSKESAKMAKAFPADEETGKEKGKEKTEEQEKFCDKNNYTSFSQSKLSAKDKFFCFKTRLNTHPYQDDDIQPPKAV